MSGYDVADRVIAPECPCCGRPIFLSLGIPAIEPDGVLRYDGALARDGMMLHLRMCEEAE